MYSLAGSGASMTGLGWAGGLVRDVRPRVAIGRSRAFWSGRGGVHDEAEDRTAHEIVQTGQFGSTECGQGWRNRLIGVAKQSTQGLSRRRSGRDGLVRAVPDGGGNEVCDPSADGNED